MQQIKVKWPLNPHETVLYKVNAVYLKSKWQAKQGAICITNERIVFETKPMMMFMLFGVIGWLLARNKKTNEFQLSDITNFQRGKQGFNKKIAEFELIDGSRYRFGLTGKWEDFDLAYQKAILDVQPLFSVQ
ncbi:GRAM domain-containing protein [Chitinophaga sp.]|uniref:GRAM domain-containing protein n=1 Tax=Chitinophaga sp. TaxID=1869181 RepID=UPI002F9353F7